MRLLADENVSRYVVERLRADGHEVSWVLEVLSGSDDERVLQAAQAQTLALITEDTDFGELVIRRRLPVTTVILLELDRLTNQAEALRVSDTLAKHGHEMLGKLIVIEPSRIRIRPLPR